MTVMTRDEKMSLIQRMLVLLRCADVWPPAAEILRMRRLMTELDVTLAECDTSEIELIGFELVYIARRRAYALANTTRTPTDNARVLKELEIEELPILGQLYKAFRSPGQPGI